MATLTDEEFRVVTYRYWHNLTDRRIGQALKMDHKKVARRHETALARLRSFYQEEMLALAA
jgi:DNA-directed RNA polymerase specialized sigma subunit